MSASAFAHRKNVAVSALFADRLAFLHIFHQEVIIMEVVVHNASDDFVGIADIVPTFVQLAFRTYNECVCTLQHTAFETVVWKHIDVYTHFCKFEMQFYEV